MSMPSLKILLVEDEPGQARLMELSLEYDLDWKPEIVHVDRLETALAAVKEQEFDAVLLDLNLPDSTGLDTVSYMVQCAGRVPVLVLSGTDDSRVERDAIGFGAQDIIQKGSVTSDVLMRLIRHAVERHALQTALDDKFSEISTLNTQFKSLIADNADAMVVLDENNVVRFVNPAAEKLFGQHACRMLDTKLPIPLEPGREAEMEINRPNDTDICVDIRVMPTMWEGERAYLATLRDISRLKRVERELRSAAEEAKAASDLKSAFLANMSHELRTPLNSIIGFSELIETESFGPVGNEAYGEYAGIVRRSGHHLLALINDLLDLSKAESDAMELHETEFDLKALVQDCITTMLPDACKRRLSIEEHVMPVRLFADTQRFTQIMQNLLSNAIKFTPEGGRIDVSASVAASGKLLLRVTDTGVGISEKDLTDVFGQFVRARSDYVAKQEGTGLGLAICKTLVELHGGGIDIDSVLGKGTIVSIMIPAARIVGADVVDIRPPDEKTPLTATA